MRTKIIREKWPEEVHCGADMEKYMISKKGFQLLKLIGTIGYSGNHVHILRVIGKYVEETAYGDVSNVLYIYSVQSVCGSAKWQSELQVFGDSDMSKVTCKNCLKMEADFLER